MPARLPPLPLLADCLCLMQSVGPTSLPLPPGLTKLVSKLSKEGAWRKALEVFEAVEEMG